MSSQEGKGLKLSSAEPPRGRVPVGLEWVVRAAISTPPPETAPGTGRGGGGGKGKGAGTQLLLWGPCWG